MTFKELKETIRADMGYVGGKPVRTFFRRYFFEAGFKFVFWLRLTKFFYGKNIILYALAALIYKHYSYKYSFDISFRAEIGKGLQIAHFGYIVIPSNTVIGENCRLRPGVVVGKKLSEKTGGAVIGNNVEFGVGCKIICGVHIGDNVIIGANAVITKDVPDDSIVAGVPAKVIAKRSRDL